MGIQHHASSPWFTDNLGVLCHARVTGQLEAELSGAWRTYD
jgi:hypothetical protein